MPGLLGRLITELSGVRAKLDKALGELMLAEIQGLSKSKILKLRIKAERLRAQLRQGIGDSLSLEAILEARTDKDRKYDDQALKDKVMEQKALIEQTWSSFSQEFYELLKVDATIKGVDAKLQETVGLQAMSAIHEISEMTEGQVLIWLLESNMFIDGVSTVKDNELYVNGVLTDAETYVKNSLLPRNAVRQIRDMLELVGEVEIVTKLAHRIIHELWFNTQ